jgi:NAD(P)-dependent dehydrogenase (short-subunit alcohol dehydrogenase family)
MLLEGNKVLVTGGARGSVKEIIMKCLDEGASVH